MALYDSALIEGWQRGDREAGERLFALLHDEFRALADAHLREERACSLASGDLVNEAVLRLTRLEKIRWADRAHFLAMAARTMRRVLTDHARFKQTDKRHHHRVTLLTGDGAVEPPVDLIDLNTALIELAELDRERAQIVEMRFFGGMALPDIAIVLDMSERTVRRRWASARAWLFTRLKD